MSLAKLLNGRWDQLVSMDYEAGWAVRRDGARAKLIDAAYADHYNGTGRVRIWRPRLADLRGIEALRWRCWERLLRADRQIGELLDRVTPLEAPACSATSMDGYAATLFAAVGDRTCAYSVRPLSSDDPHYVGGFLGPTTGRRFVYLSDWTDDRSGRWPEHPEPSPDGQRMRQLDRYVYTLATRLSATTNALDLALERRLGKGRDGDVARVLVNGREHWATCVALGRTDPRASPYWRPIDRPEDRRVFTLNLDEEQA